MTERSDNSHTQAIMFQISGGMVSCWLIDHLDKLGLNDALIRGHQPEPVNACCGRNGPVGGVSQDTRQGDIQRHFIRQRKNAQKGFGIQVLEKVIQGHFQSRFFAACENRDLQ
jgi:hypothetical protein